VAKPKTAGASRPQHVAGVCFQKATGRRFKFVLEKWWPMIKAAGIKAD
jgi:hypothetical protein